MSKTLMIVNPKAGKLRARARLFELIQPFCQAGEEVQVAITQHRGQAVELAKNSTADRVVCVGGDGTLNEVINGVIQSGRRCPIGYIPAGSTNDFAGTLGLSKNMVKAVEDILCGTPWAIDIGQFHDRYFSYVASFGLFTRPSYATDQNMKNIFGHFAYVLEGTKELGNIKSYAMKIDADGIAHDGNYIFGAVTNTTSMGGIIKMKNKDIKLDDGLFEVFLVRRPKNVVELQQTVHAITTNTFQAPTIDFFTTKELTVMGRRKLDWSIDGEKYTAPETLVIRNLPQAVSIITNEK